MTSERVARRLAAILAADVVGYSRLMGRDESSTLARLKAHRTGRLEPVLARYGGRLVKLTGDGALVEFPSAVDALGAAIEFQQCMAEANLDQSEDTAIVFRIGLHLGDLIVEGDDLYGDGVNVAARLETEASPGGIVVSRAIREAVEGRVKAKLHALGELALKNIERPIRAFRVEWDAADWKVTQAKAPQAAVSVAPTGPALALPDKPSIAVLPFQNMSGDPEQEYFADGMVEDIITALARFPSLFVIARNSSSSYKGRSPDVREVGRELGVRYVLEGSVRKAGNKVRITGQLIEAASGAHLWADRYDGELDDVFALQDRITESVAGVIAPSIERAEIERVRRKPSNSLDAYDLYLRALPPLYSMTLEGNTECRELLRRAISLDPGYAAAHFMLAQSIDDAIVQGWFTAEEQGPGLLDLLRLACRLDKQNADALAAQGCDLAYLGGSHDEALALVRQAIAINPNSAMVWFYSGWTHVYARNSATALDHLEKALRLNPRDPLDFKTWNGIAIALIQLERDEEAVDAAQRAVRSNPHFTSSWRALASSLALAGRVEEARKAMDKSLRLQPGQTATRRIAQRANSSPPTSRYLAGLRLAGLPD